MKVKKSQFEQLKQKLSKSAKNPPEFQEIVKKVDKFKSERKLRGSKNAPEQLATGFFYPFNFRKS